MAGSFWQVLWLLSLIFVILFSFVIIYGAPFLPTLNKQIPDIFELLQLKKGQTLLELGSGDGRVLEAAAKKGINSIGYELNPILFMYSWLKTRKYRKYVRVIWGNYWKTRLPKADAIFVFLLNPYMEKLDNKIAQECAKPVKLVSFAFKIPDKKITREKKAIFLYLYK